MLFQSLYLFNDIHCNVKDAQNGMLRLKTYFFLLITTIKSLHQFHLFKYHECTLCSNIHFRGMNINLISLKFILYPTKYHFVVTAIIC